MKITGQAQFTKETNQEKFYNGSAGFQAGEFTVKVKNIEFNDRENRYFTIVFENDEGKQYKHNQFVPPYKYDFQEKQLIELVTRLGIKLNLPSLDFDTNDLIGKFCHLVLKWKFNEDEGKYFTDFSFIKPYKRAMMLLTNLFRRQISKKLKKITGHNNKHQCLNKAIHLKAVANLDMTTKI